MFIIRKLKSFFPLKWNNSQENKSGFFILARCNDGFYRFGSIVGKNSNENSFIVYFYHCLNCQTVCRQNILVNHGNLFSFEVSFLSKKKRHLRGIVYGNNSPTTKDGKPTIFFIKPMKSKRNWYKINYQRIFLTNKQFINAYIMKRLIKNC